MWISYTIHEILIEGLKSQWLLFINSNYLSLKRMCSSRGKKKKCKRKTGSKPTLNP